MKHLIAVVFGLWCVRPSNQCLAPGNPMAYASTPVPVQHTTCTDFQVYESSSHGSYDPECGYAVAFGHLGDLKNPADSYWIQGDWVYIPTYQTDCEDSYTWGTAWGFKCDDPPCRRGEGEWERMGAEQYRRGNWDSVSNKCSLDVNIHAGAANYITVQGHALAYRLSGTNHVHQIAKVRIVVSRNTGGCLSATPIPPSPPVIRTPPPTPGPVAPTGTPSPQPSPTGKNQR